MSRSYCTLSNGKEGVERRSLHVKFNHGNGELSFAAEETFSTELTLTHSQKKDFIEQLFRLDDDAKDIFTKNKHGLSNQDIHNLASILEKERRGFLDSEVSAEDKEELYTTLQQLL
jgi:hypothetical protein